MTFEQVHEWLLRVLPDRPGLVLDVGAGTGRDAGWLAAQGMKWSPRTLSGHAGRGSKMAKRLLRDWLCSNLPAADSYAKKTGFNPPVGQWIAARKTRIEALVSAQPGIAEIFTREDVHRVFWNLEKTPLAAWSLLFYALWHSHHVLGLACDGTINDVLFAACGLG